MRVLELYSGIGGMHFALKESGVEGSVVASIDINTVANEVYKHNFPGTRNLNQNLQSLKLETIERMDIDTILMSPPCQPFTRLGLKKDTADNRTSSFLHVLKLLPQLKNLKYILLENVKGFETSETREELIDCLNKSGFDYKELLLSPCQFGIPNTRHRYYLLAKKRNLKFVFGYSTFITELPAEILEILPPSKHTELVEEDNFVNPKNGKKCFKLKRILEKGENLDSKYLIPSKLLSNRIHVLDMRTPEMNGSCCFTKAYTRYLEGTGSVLSQNTETELQQKLTEILAMKEDSTERLDSLSNLKLRFFTPKEISRLMSFPADFAFPDAVTDKQRYRLLGNSINVYVVSRLIFLLQYDSYL